MKIKKILLFSLIIFISHTIIVSALTGSGSVTVTVIPLPPTNLTSSCPSPGTSASLSWTLPSGYTLSYLRVFDNVTGGYAALIPEWSADNGPSFSFASTPGHNYTSWVHTRLPNGASSSEIYSSFNCIPAPTGILTASPTSCTIASGASSCNVNLTWTTTNPVDTSKITSNYPSANTTLVVINNWSNWSMDVPYLSSPRILYLYNNAILLAQTTVTSSCAINTTWNGSVCTLNPYTVSTSAGSGCSITPASRIVNHGSTTTFTVTPNSGYSISSVSGCSGLRSGNNYATGPITAACTVTATCSPILLVPTVTTTPVTSITQTTATGGGTVVSNGGTSVTGSGIVWSTSINPTTANSKTTNGWALGGPWTPTPSMVGLTPNTLYYVRAYATNPVGTSYGANVSFTTSPILLVPTVTTTTLITSITQTTATGGGTVVSNGGATVTVSGIVWSTSINPTIANSKTTNGWYIGGPWTSGMTGLTSNTTYYVRAYATNSVGTSYGANVLFATPIITYTVTGVTAPVTGANGAISPATRTGVSHGSTTMFIVNPNPGYTASASGCGGSLSGILYTTGAITAACTVTATFSPRLLAPTVTTNSITNKTQTTATGGGNVTSNGGATVTIGGIVWSTSAIPTTGAPTLPTKTVNSNWADYSTWADNMTGLTSNTLYHVRAYATNSVGTAYGADVTFTATTANLPPTVNAGFDRFITLPVSSTTIPGASSTDSDGSISGNAWTFRAGPGVTPTITDGSTLTPTFSNMTSAGVYTFRLTATDNQGLQNYDEMTVTVSPVIIPPDSAIVSFSANPSMIFKGRSSTLTWSSTNADLGCTGSQDFGSDFNTGDNASGSDLVTPIQTTRYTLTCSSSKPSSTSSYTITKVIILNIKEQ